VSRRDLLREIEADVIALKSARPTAVNLSWGVDATVRFIKNNLPEEFEDPSVAVKNVTKFVESLADKDVETNKKLSDYGAKLFRSGDSVLTHCN
jgi:methylthioribose-1-phosphate isomerase